MSFSNYNELLKPSDLDNFRTSLDKPNGFTFNSLINILQEEEVKYEIMKGFNYQSTDSDIKDFNKIEIKFKTNNIDKIFQDYSLNEVFNINKTKKDIYSFTIKS